MKKIVLLDEEAHVRIYYYPEGDDLWMRVGKYCMSVQKREENRGFGKGWICTDLQALLNLELLASQNEDQKKEVRNGDTKEKGS